MENHFSEPLDIEDVLSETSPENEEEVSFNKVKRKNKFKL